VAAGAQLVQRAGPAELVGVRHLGPDETALHVAVDLAGGGLAGVPSGTSQAWSLFLTTV